MSRYPKAVVDEHVSFFITGSSQVQVEEALVHYKKDYPSTKHGPINEKDLWAGTKKLQWIVYGTRKL